MSVDSDSPTRDEPPYSAAALTTERDAELVEKMPASVRRFATNLQRATGRTFTCPNCDAPSTGTCNECNYTHPRLRSDDR